MVHASRIADEAMQYFKTHFRPPSNKLNPLKPSPKLINLSKEKIPWDRIAELMLFPKTNRSPGERILNDDEILERRKGLLNLIIAEHKKIPLNISNQKDSNAFFDILRRIIERKSNPYSDLALVLHVIENLVARGKTTVKLPDVHTSIWHFIMCEKEYAEGWHVRQNWLRIITGGNPYGFVGL